jgi:DNA-binding response OmpR family regulator
MTAVRILIVDDDEGVRKSLSAALKTAGYVVDTAESGKEAIEKSNTNSYNLALIDIRLPDIEGTELLTATRETTPKTIKIILTGYPSLQNAVEAVNRGADGYVIKPAQTEDLLKMIGEHLRKQEAAKQYSELKVKEYVETRFKELETEEE